jgi:hypothetical protein
VLNAYKSMCHSPGGFRVWWRRLHHDSDEDLDNAHLMRIPGLNRDEYPPAMLEEGGTGSSVCGIDPSDNRGAGSSMGRSAGGGPDGSIIRIVLGF